VWIENKPRRSRWAWSRRAVFFWPDRPDPAIGCYRISISRGRKGNQRLSDFGRTESEARGQTELLYSTVPASTVQHSVPRVPAPGPYNNKKYYNAVCSTLSHNTRTKPGPNLKAKLGLGTSHRRIRHRTILGSSKGPKFSLKPLKLHFLPGVSR
jgi:hypothetical protein